MVPVNVYIERVISVTYLFSGVTNLVDILCCQKSKMAYFRKTVTTSVYYLFPGSGVKYRDQYVHLSVCPLAYLRNRRVKLYRIFRHVACGVWQWLGPPLTAF